PGAQAVQQLPLEHRGPTGYRRTARRSSGARIPGKPGLRDRSALRARQPRRATGGGPRPHPSGSDLIVTSGGDNSTRADQQAAMAVPIVLLGRNRPGRLRIREELGATWKVVGEENSEGPA